MAWSSGTCDPRCSQCNPCFIFNKNHWLCLGVQTFNDAPLATQCDTYCCQVDGLSCWFGSNVMWSFIKIVQDGFEGSWGSWNHLLYEGIARLLLEVLKCCIQRNWSRDLRNAQKKSGNAKLSMVLVYTSSKAVKKVASKKRYQAWNGYRESMDNKLSRQNWELMTCKFGISSSTWLFSGSMSILGWRRLETQKLWWVKHVEALRQKLLWR